MPGSKSWPRCYANPLGCLFLINPNSHPHLKWACVVRQFPEHAWCLDHPLCTRPRLLAIDYSLHYRHPLDQVSQEKEIGIEIGAKDICLLYQPICYCWWSIKLDTRQQLPKSKNVASNKASVLCLPGQSVLALYLAGYTTVRSLNWYVYQEQGTTGESLSISECLRYSPSTACPRKKILDMRQRDSDDHIGNQDSARVWRSRCAWREWRSRKLERREKKKKICR